MVYVTVIVLNFFVGLVSCDCASSLPNFLHEITLDVTPAFTSLIYNPDTKQYDLGVSSFTGRINVADQVLRIPEVSNNYANLPGLKTGLVTNELVWPNEVKGVPEGIFGDSHMWDVANAFFLPGKSKGSISVINMTDPVSPSAPVPISSEDGKDWFYHRVLWEDMDNDGDLDAVTERAYGNGADAEESQSVWFENPGLSYPVPNWQSHVIYSNFEDVAFRLHKFPLPDDTETLVLISAGFYSHSLTLTWPENGDWSDGSSMNHVVIDEFGWYFDVEITDLNKDGNLDILTTTWSQPGFNGSVLAYEMPSGDWRTDTWTRQILSLDFKESTINGNGSPGSAQTFWPTREMEENGEKPYIVVSGDDDGKAYLLVPDQQTEWSYTQCLLYSTDLGDLSVVGAIAVGDVDQDGFSELFIPWYTGRRIAVMTYRPQ